MDYTIHKMTQKSDGKYNNDVLTNIRKIIHNEFDNDLVARENQLIDIQNNITKVSQTLHLMRYVLIKKYYTPLIDDNLNSDVKTRRKLKNDELGLKNDIKQEEIDVADEISMNSDSINPASNLIAVRNRIMHKKMLKIGNISKWIGNSQLLNTKITHKWMIYVNVGENDEKISDFIEKIVFHLHPSYKPNDVIELSEEPFRLTRKGWGEFPVRLQLHFKCKLNKPIDTVHHLVLDKKRSGEQTYGNETSIQLNLYDDHDTIDTSSIETGEDKVIKNIILSNDNDYDYSILKEHSYAINANNFREAIVQFQRERFKTVLEALPFLLKRLPMIDKQASDLNYKAMFPFTARNYEEFVQWPLEKRLAAEWFRAKCVLRYLNRAKFCTKQWNAKKIILYARAHAYIDLVPLNIFANRNYREDFLLDQTVHKFKANSGLKSTVDTVDVETTTEEVDANILIVSKQLNDGTFAFIKEKALDVGVLLQPEIVISGYKYHAAHNMILTAMCCLAEELIRKARALKVYDHVNLNEIDVDDIQNVLQTHRSEFRIFRKC